jgi:hypothetical protein
MGGLLKTRKIVDYAAVTSKSSRHAPATNLIAHLMRMVVYLVRNEEFPNAKTT